MDRFANLFDEDDIDSILSLEALITAPFSSDKSLPSIHCTGATKFNIISSETNLTDQFTSTTSMENVVCDSSQQSRLGNDTNSLHLENHHNFNDNETGPNFEEIESTQLSQLSLEDHEFEKNNRMSTSSSKTTFLIGPTPNLNKIPSSIIKLYRAVRNSLSDFSFVYAMSAQMCQDDMPMECYVEFKMGLLLSLASIQTNSNQPPLPVVGFGLNTSSANLIMTNVGNMAERFATFPGTFEPLVLKNENIVSTCPLLLATGGVYYLGEWSCLKEASTRQILRDINCGYVSVSNAPITCPLRTAVWCFWINYKNNNRDLKYLLTLLKIFGIPFILEETSSEAQCDFLLGQAMNANYVIPNDELSISFDEMRQYIAEVSKRNVEMPLESATLLQKYFVASRLDRPDCLTERAFVSLKQMSESFAKLSFHDHVTKHDVIAAIYMSEHFINNIFGAGVFSPPLRSGQSTKDVECVEKMFNCFEEWLMIYLERFKIDEASQEI